MKCPNCPDSTLQMTDRQGIEIDYCPSCRGIWLDRGELDKLIERAAAHEAPRAAAQRQPQAPVQPSQRRPDFADFDYHHGHGGQRRRTSWLSDLFD